MMNVSTSGKSRLQDKLDKWFWFLMALFPIVMYMIYWLNIDYNVVVSEETINGVTTYTYDSFGFLNFGEFLDNLLFINGTGFLGLIRDVLYGIFGADGVFPVFRYGYSFLSYIAYYVCLQVLHVLVDVLVFIPRFAHKILSKAINFGE